jgi:hypothetical protein
MALIPLIGQIANISIRHPKVLLALKSFFSLLASSAALNLWNPFLSIRHILVIFRVLPSQIRQAFCESLSLEAKLQAIALINSERN